MEKLKECPSSPNCVCTQSQQPSKKMAAIPFNPGQQNIPSLIKEIISQIPRTQLKEDHGNYLHFTFTSLIFRFVDDIEFLIDEKLGEIHFRSASRVGRSDLGANRKRMNILTQKISERLS